MKLFHDNKITSASLVASSTKTGYDLNNLKIPQLARRFSFDGNSGNIVITFAQAEKIRYCIIDIGNMTQDATITLQAHTSDTWTSPAYSENMTITESAVYIELDEEYRYWRLVLSDSSLSDLEFGYISIGDEGLQLPGIDPGADLYYNTTSENSFSIGGQFYGDEGYEYLETAFTFPQIGEDNIVINGVECASRKDILNMWSKIQNITPIWVFLWSNNLDEHPPVFCVIAQNKLNFKKLAYGKYYSTSLSLRSVL
jgi:hypothetical protein